MTEYGFQIKLKKVVFSNNFYQHHLENLPLYDEDIGSAGANSIFPELLSVKPNGVEMSGYGETGSATVFAALISNMAKFVKKSALIL